MWNIGPEEAQRPNSYTRWHFVITETEIYSYSLPLSLSVSLIWLSSTVFLSKNSAKRSGFKHRPGPGSIKNEYIQISGWHDPPGQRPRLAPQDPHHQILCWYYSPISLHIVIAITLLGDQCIFSISYISICAEWNLKPTCLKL